MTLEQYQTVANGCPAAEISIGCKWHRVADATAGLGDRLTKLHVAFGAASDLAALRMGAAACPRLREIKWVTFGRDKSEMETFLLVQHPELHSLVVSTRTRVGFCLYWRVSDFWYTGTHFPGIFRELAR